MAETLLSFGLEKLWNLLVRESERFQGVDEQLNGFKSDLSMLRCFLKDADVKKHTSEMVRNTVKEIKEIVFDAEDIVEAFLLKEELGKSSIWFTRFASVTVKRRRLAFDMEGISKRISKVIRDMKSLGVQQVIVNERYTQPLQEIQREMRQTFPNDNESVLVGLEKNVEILVGHLVEEGSHSQVVSITGMGGIGKTTLARQVFNHETIKSSFPGLAWVCVSQQFTRKYVWQTILRQLRPDYKVLDMTEDELQEKLVRVLETEKALIVIDDIWREGDWDRIKQVFLPKKGEPPYVTYAGWKVLFTSRNAGVALHADPKCVTFKPECLTFEESWNLFQRIAFPAQYKVDDEMEEMGKQMIKHCGGLPLAVKVLGGLLAPQYTLAEWKRVYENIRSHIVGGTSFNDRNIASVYHILYLSFEELPVYLKHCFLYLAHFPEDCAIDVEKLSYYWAAEGIPRPMYYKGASIQDVGDGYIEELVKRNMVISERDGRTSRYKTCQLHDMMRELCLLKAEEENFVQIVQGTSTANSKSPFKSRRLAVHELYKTINVEKELKNPSLKTLLFILGLGLVNREARCLDFTRIQLMRVLDLSFVEFEGGKVPSSIGKLIHLRYLSLYATRVTNLPSSMRNLKLLLYLNLQLQVSMDSPLYMFSFLKEMRELTYLCLPKTLHDKTKLELANLVNLETLENFLTKHVSASDLQGMRRLNTLSIIGDGCSMETLSSYLSELTCLENLTIHDSTYDREGFVLDCVNLKHVKLNIYMPRLPDEQHLPRHLIYLELRKCRLEEDPMPILEKLSHLKEVELLCDAFNGRRMVCSRGGFPQLHKLVIWGLKEWEEWIVEEGSMQLLQTLTIRHCKKLAELPDGLRFITSLEELDMNIYTLEFWKRLSSGGEDYCKIQHIPLLNFV